jgi:uncharacterized protein YdaU (DUF1376 family)
MAKAPIMPVFTDALIGDTTHLSTEQFGAYVLILLATWRNNGRALPDDDARMARLCRAGVQRWRAKLRPALVEFFDISDGLWHQHRLEKEWARVTSLIAKRRASAAAGGRATAARNAATEGARKDNLEDSEELFDRPESLNAARAKEKKSTEVNPEGGRYAPLGDNLAVQPEWDTPKTRMPARLADRHRDGECDAVPSQAPASDYRGVDCENQGHGAPLAGGGQPETVDLSRRGNDVRLAPAGSASGPSTRFDALRGCEPCPRTGQSPALKAKKPPVVKFQLLPKKQARFLWAYREDLAWGYLEATQLDANNQPVDPVAFQRAIDGVGKLIKLKRWQDPHAAAISRWKRQQGIAA